MAAGEVHLVFGPPAAAYIRTLVSPYVDRGLPVRFVELSADLSTRLERNVASDRLAAKPSKRDLVWSEAHLRERETAFTMNTSPDLAMPGEAVLADFPHLRVDTTVLQPGEAADRILAWCRSTDSGGRGR